MVPTATQLFAQEKVDAQAERAVMDRRADVHAASEAQRDGKEHAHEVRMFVAKAKRELEAQQRKEAFEGAVAKAERDATLSAKQDELRAMRAEKQGKWDQQKQETEAILAEGAELQTQQIAHRDRQRTKVWQAREKVDKHMAEQAQQVHESTQKLASARLGDHSAMATLFRIMDIDQSGFIQPSEFVWVMAAVMTHGPLTLHGQSVLGADYRRPGSNMLKTVLRDFNASANGRVSLSGLKNWWDDKGMLGQGIGSTALRVFSTGQTGHGSGTALVEQTLTCIEKQNDLEAATVIQSSIRRRQAQQQFVQAKRTGKLPGSARLVALKLQSFMRMRMSQKHYAKMRRASITISSALRRRHAWITFQIMQDTKKQEGYSFAARTVHVGGISKAWEGEEKLTSWFARGGPVLSTVVRVRPPEHSGDPPNNSWALVVFEHEATMNDLLRLNAQEHHDERSPQQVDVVRLKADAGEKGDNPTTFIVRRIDPAKAMMSVGSFGKVLQSCIEKVDDQHKRRRREAKARVKREEERQTRWRVLATKPQVPKLTKEELGRIEAEARMIADMQLSSLHKRLDGDGDAPAPPPDQLAQEQVVIAEYVDGWHHCCQWPPAGATVCNPAPTLTEMEQQGQPYYFNARSGESRWLPPPQLTRLSKTKPKGQFAKLHTPVVKQVGRAKTTAATAESKGAAKLPAAGAPVRKGGRPNVAKSSGGAASSIYALQPQLWLNGAARGRPQSAREPTATEIRAGGGRADGHQRLRMAPRRPATASSGGPARAWKNRRVVEVAAPVAAEEDMDPVAYMEQWQHQKASSGPEYGPNNTHYGCFMPSAGHPASPMLWAGKSAGVR